MSTDFEHVADSLSANDEYRFGTPKTYLTAHEVARLILLRSRLGETRAERTAEDVPAAPWDAERRAST